MAAVKGTALRLLRGVTKLAQFSRYVGRRVWRRLHNAELADVLKKSPAEHWRLLRAAYHRAGFAFATQFGDRAAARDALHAAARALPNDDDLQFALSRAQLNAGAQDAAEEAMRKVIALRARALSSATLEQSLAKLRVEPGVLAARSALNWGWRHLSSPGADRADWERAAHFGFASNKLIWTWANCAPDRLGELDKLILPLEDSRERVLRGANRGILLLGFHIGVPHAAVHCFRSREYRIRIFGREPGTTLLGTEHHYINSDERLALRQVLRALDHGISVGLLVDAPSAGASAEIQLPGRARLSLMRSISKLIWKHQIGYMYCFPLWDGQRIRVDLDRDVPVPLDGESCELWERRWLRASQEKLLAVLRSGPENLRLTGGLWSQFS